MKILLALGMWSVLAMSLAFGSLKSGVQHMPDTAVEKAGAPPEDVTTEQVAVSDVPGNPVPEQFRQAYFGGRPAKFLVDPQDLLSPVDFRERLDFLNYHASDSAIDLYVYVFPSDQDIPGEVRVEEVVEHYFAEGRPAVMIYYFFGDPQRSALYLSPSLRVVVPPGEQRRALESSVMQALKEVHPAAQIEAFLVQMSIRIYWMERMLGGAAESEPVPARPKMVLKPKPGPLDVVRPYLESASRHVVTAALIAGMLVAAFGTRFWLNRRTRHRFPDFEVEPRLGGDHAAGVGAVISFASAAVTPSSQRNQMPDYLRRA